jgi:hypothetical protein
MLAAGVTKILSDGHGGVIRGFRDNGLDFACSRPDEISLVDAFDRPVNRWLLFKPPSEAN